MPFVLRDKSGAIIACSESALPEYESVDAESDELAVFLASMSSKSTLIDTDLDFIRVVEDVIELLIAKNIILFTELPPSAQQKMLTRQDLRARVRESLDLLSDEES